MRLFDPSAFPGDNPFAVPSTAARQNPVPLPVNLRLRDASAFPGDNPLAAGAPHQSLPINPGTVLATISIPVAYAPNPLTAALQITEAGVNEGAYPCAVSGPAADGITYTLTASLTSIPVGLTPGKISVDPGDIGTDGVFVPAQVSGAAVVPSLGTLTLSGISAPVPDLTVTLGAPQADVADVSPFQANSDGFVHVPVSAVSQADGTAVDLSTWAVLLAITRVSPAPSDFQAGDWLVVTAPVSAAGLYARLAVSVSAGTALAAGNYRVYVQLLAPQAAGTLTRRCPGYLSVQS